MRNEQDKQYVFQFECSENWEKLTETEDEKIRHCGRCDKNVYLVENHREFTAGAQKGRCVYAVEIALPGMPANSPDFENRKFAKADKVRALPISYRLIQLVLFFVAALPLVSFLPLFIQKTMTRSQTSGGDVVDYDWQIRTLYGFLSNYRHFRPEENFFFWLTINLGLACFYAFVVALIIVFISIYNWQRKSSNK